MFKEYGSTDFVPDREENSEKKRISGVTLIGSVILLALVVVASHHTRKETLTKGLESSRPFFMEKSASEGVVVDDSNSELEKDMARGDVFEDRTSDWKKEETLFDGEIPEHERLVEPQADSSGSVLAHPECPAEMRRFLDKQSEEEQASIGRWSDALHLEQQKEHEVMLGYSDRGNGKSRMHVFTVEDMKYALDSGVMDLKPFEKEVVSADGTRRAYLFGNGMVLTADMKQCRIVGVFLPQPDGSLNEFAKEELLASMEETASSGKEVTADGCKKKVYEMCVKSGVMCGRRSKCPSGWKRIGRFPKVCSKKAKHVFNPLCVVPKTPPGTRFQGCREDSTTRLLKARRFVHRRLNAYKCSALCKKYEYFAMENGKECYCGNVLHPRPFSGNCKTKCPGDGSQICGGKWAAMVFKRLGFQPDIYGYRSKGCWKDTSSKRVLSATAAGESTSMSLRECSQYCVSSKYFGVKNGNECYCGNSMTSTSASTGCTKQCAGASAQKCGGTNAIGVYEKSMSDPSMSLARKFGPQVAYNRKTKGYPMDAQIYYEKVFVGGKKAKWKSKPWCHFEKITEQSKFDTSKMATYFTIGHCGERTSITYNFFYGFQYPCLEVLNCFPQGWHAGDWERTTVVLTKDEKGIEFVYYEQHGGAYTRYPEGFGVVDQLHPKVYAGYSAHGSYHRGSVPGQHSWHKCQYFGDCLSGKNPRLWKTWEGKMYNMAEKKQTWMTDAGRAVVEANSYMIFKNVYNKVAPNYDSCSEGNCAKTGCQATQCGIKNDCGPCTTANAPFVCHGWGLGSRDYWCCRKKCQKKKKDWLGVGYCPHECKKCPVCKKGSC